MSNVKLCDIHETVLKEHETTLNNHESRIQKLEKSDEVFSVKLDITNKILSAIAVMIGSAVVTYFFNLMNR